MNIKRFSHLVKGVARINPNLNIISASGVWVKNDAHKRFLDLTSGIGALSTGHCHPFVVKRVQDQAAVLVHPQQNCVGTYPAAQELMSEFENMNLPPEMNQVYFSNSGTDAIENAIKLAKKTTGRPNIISFIGGFHGRSFGGMSVSTSKVSCRDGYSPLLSGIYQIPFPYEGCDLEYAMDTVHNLLKRISSPDDTAAFLIEPILGEGGIVRVNKEFMVFLRKICNYHNILLIADEVQTGCGRTGQWWGFESWGASAKPDIVTFGKGVASGYPLAGVISLESFFNTIHPNGLGGTYNGNAVSVAAAVETIPLIRNELDSISSKGELFVTELKKANLPIIKEIRQYGLMIAIDLDISESKFKNLVQKAIDYEILILTTGIATTIRLLPPLNISENEIQLAVSRISNLLKST